MILLDLVILQKLEQKIIQQFSFAFFNIIFTVQTALAKFQGISRCQAGHISMGFLQASVNAVLIPPLCSSSTLPHDENKSFCSKKIVGVAHRRRERPFAQPLENIKNKESRNNSQMLSKVWVVAGQFEASSVDTRGTTVPTSKVFQKQCLLEARLLLLLPVRIMTALKQQFPPGETLAKAIYSGRFIHCYTALLVKLQCLERSLYLPFTN